VIELRGVDSPTIWTLQVAVVLPEGADPLDIPRLGRLEDGVRRLVGSETERVHIDTFTVRPGAVQSYLVSVLDMHVIQPDGACFCGSWTPASEGSHPEHVAAVFAEATRAHAVA
jgi:hypothetical protein